MSRHDDLLERLAMELARLPGVGKRNARRMALKLILASDDFPQRLAHAILDARQGVRQCRRCGNLCGEELCEICRSPRRDPSLICVVEEVPDLWAIEEGGMFEGHYHVLGGVLSPLEGVGPGDLRIGELRQRIEAGGVRELIIATNPTVEGDATAYYLARSLASSEVIISRIAIGLPKGADIEFADRSTLENALASRTVIHLSA